MSLSQLSKIISDVKDLALTSLLIAAHITMGGETALSMIELAIDVAARFALESGIIQESKDLNTLLNNIKTALTTSRIKVADSIVHASSSKEIEVRISNCAFKTLCNCLMMRWDRYASLFGRRPCAVASFYRYVLERCLGKKYDIVSVDCTQGSGSFKLREL